MINYKVVDQQKFNESGVLDVKVDVRRQESPDSFWGNVSINFKEEGWVDSTGEHSIGGFSEFEELYGFELTQD